MDSLPAGITRVNGCSPNTFWYWFVSYLVWVTVATVYFQFACRVVVLLFGWFLCLGLVFFILLIIVCSCHFLNVNFSWVFHRNDLYRKHNLFTLWLCFSSLIWVVPDIWIDLRRFFYLFNLRLFFNSLIVLCILLFVSCHDANSRVSKPLRSQSRIDSSVSSFLVATPCELRVLGLIKDTQDLSRQVSLLNHSIFTLSGKADFENLLETAFGFLLQLVLDVLKHLYRYPLDSWRLFQAYVKLVE